MPYDEFADDGDSGDESHGGGIAAIPGGLPPLPPPFPASATPATPAPLSEDDREFAELARQLIARLPAASASQLSLVCEVGPNACFSSGPARLCAPENVERASRGPHRTPAAARPYAGGERGRCAAATCSATSKAGLRSAEARARADARSRSLSSLLLGAPRAVLRRPRRARAPQHEDSDSRRRARPDAACRGLLQPPAFPSSLWRRRAE